MKLDRVSNAKKGIFFGLINCSASLLLPFIVQTILIRQLGLEYGGIKGLFTSIITVFNLAELGFGSAVVFSMYKPIAEDDIETICSLLNLFRKVYKCVGIVIITLGVIILPFLDIFVKDSYPNEINIKIVFLLYLINTVVSYLFFGYKVCLLNAFQRTDILSIINTIMQLVSSAFQVLLLIIWRNFYLFIGISIISTILNNFIISCFVNKMYPEIKCEGTIDRKLFRELKKKVFGLLIAKVCGVTRNSFDSIFISIFLGLTQTAIYSNYFMIFNALNMVTSIILSSILAGIGNSIALESKEKNYKDMIVLNNIYLFFSGMISIGMLCLYQPIMSLWIGDKSIFPNYIMFLFPIYFYIGKMGDIRGVYSDAAGLFWENKFRCLIEAIANIFLNYFLGKLFGVWGILLATIITLFFVGFLGSTYVIFKYYFASGQKRYLIGQFFLMIFNFVIGVTLYKICTIFFAEYTFCNLIFRTMLCIFFIPFLYWISFRNTDSYKNVVIALKKILHIA